MNTPKKNIIIFLLLLSIPVFSQQNLKNYYKYVAIAENFIISEQYDSAVVSYQKAFKNKNFPFGDDLENAAFCESKLEQPSFERCKYYIENGISKWKLNNLGIDTMFVKNITLITAFKQKIYDSIMEMVKRDQKIRYTKNSYSKDSIYWAKIDSVDNKNIQIFEQIFKKYNLFDEKLIRNNLDDLKLLLNHWLGKKNFRIFIEPLMYKSVKEGLLDARFFSQVLDYNDYRWGEDTICNYGTYLLKIFISENNDDNIENRIYFAYFDFDKNNSNNVEKINEINRKRKDIYLDDVFKDRARELKFYVFRAETQKIPYTLYAPSIFISGFEKNDSLLQDKIKKNPNLIYYIQGKYDFNIK
jgi:hypothetical protein